MKILVTGFEPFGPDAVNAAWEAVSRLPEVIGGAEILKRQLPVEYEAGPARLKALIGELAPDAVLSVGQAAGRHPWGGGPGPAESQRRGLPLQLPPLSPGGAGQGAGHPWGVPSRALLLRAGAG